ncbi:hypothetical protein [Jiella sonneratiae]|uniref:Uncharacterized protein n=1 Tax=Jiella sonneratiae TaxID=2816856 RepID=A0ABS3J460_9HYPH|nr:hypothetical protein [Jiella sonneratiae]MBO0903910.1 hypothetical protein [Jiella sonneratiae]
MSLPRSVFVGLSRAAARLGMALALALLVLLAAPSLSVAAEEVGLLVLAARPHPDAMPADSAATRALLSGIAAGLTTGAGRERLMRFNGASVRLVDPAVLGADPAPDPAASDRAILDLLQKRDAKDPHAVDVLLRLSLRTFVAPDPAGKPSDVDLRLAADLSLRDVASGRPLGMAPEHRTARLPDCGSPPSGNCIRDFLADEATAFGRDIGLKLAFQLSALLPRREADDGAPGGGEEAPDADEPKPSDDGKGDDGESDKGESDKGEGAGGGGASADAGAAVSPGPPVETACGDDGRTVTLTLRLLPVGKRSELEDRLAAMACARSLEPGRSSLAEASYDLTTTLPQDSLQPALEKIVAELAIDAVVRPAGPQGLLVEAR